MERRCSSIAAVRAGVTPRRRPRVARAAKISWSTKISARMAQPSPDERHFALDRVEGDGVRSAGRRRSARCAARSAGSSRSKADGAVADEGDRRGVDQREQAAEAVAERLAGLAEGLAFRSVGCARACGERLHVGVADVVRGRGVLAHAPGVAPDRVVAGIGLDAAAAAAAAERAVRPVDHVAELAAGRLRAGEELALQHQAHADAVRQQDRRRSSSR